MRRGEDDDRAGDHLLDPVVQSSLVQPLPTTVIISAPISVPKTVPCPPDEAVRRR